MRDKLKDLDDTKHKTSEYVISYYLHDIAESVRELLAAREQPLSSTPGEIFDDYPTQTEIRRKLLDVKPFSTQEIENNATVAPDNIIQGTIVTKTGDVSFDYKLPILEFQPGTLPMKASDVLKELGYEDAEELRLKRLEEGIANDPRVQGVMSDYVESMTINEMQKEITRLQEVMYTIMHDIIEKRQEPSIKKGY